MRIHGNSHVIVDGGRCTWDSDTAVTDTVALYDGNLKFTETYGRVVLMLLVAILPETLRNKMMDRRTMHKPAAALEIEHHTDTRNLGRIGKFEQYFCVSIELHRTLRRYWCLCRRSRTPQGGCT